MANQYLSESGEATHHTDHDRRSLNEMLQELRVLQQGSQILVGFLILLPFSEGFTKIAPFEKGVYITAFVCAIVSLICYSAPAAQHRIERPLRHRIRFKKLSTRIILVGTLALSIALVSTTQLVLNEVLGSQGSSTLTIIVGLFISLIWWILPLFQRFKQH